MNKIDKNIKELPHLLRKISEKVTLDKIAINKFVLIDAANLIDHLAKIREKAKELVKEHYEN